MGGAAAPEAAAHAVQHPAERPPLGGEPGPAQREEQLPEDPAARDQQQRARDREQRRRLAAQPLARMARDLERVDGTAPGRELPLELQALRRDPILQALAPLGELPGPQPHRKCSMSVASSCSVALNAWPFAFAFFTNTAQSTAAPATRTSAMMPGAHSRYGVSQNAATTRKAANTMPRNSASSASAATSASSISRDCSSESSVTSSSSREWTISTDVRAMPFSESMIPLA